MRSETSDFVSDFVTVTNGRGTNTQDLLEEFAFPLTSCRSIKSSSPSSAMAKSREPINAPQSITEVFRALNTQGQNSQTFPAFPLLKSKVYAPVKP